MEGYQKVQVNYIGESINHVYSLPLTPGERKRKQGRNGTGQLKLGAGGQDRGQMMWVIRADYLRE